MALQSLNRISLCARITQVFKVSCDVRLYHNLEKKVFCVYDSKLVTFSFNNMNRNFPKCIRVYSIKSVPKSESKSDQLAISHPRLYKQYALEREADGLSKDWEIIFSRSYMDKKLKMIQWITSVVICCLPFAAAFGWWEFEIEEGVVMAGFEVSKRFELMLFYGFNFLFCSAINRITRRVPRRMYHREESDSYVAVVQSIFPWKCSRVYFKSTDILDLPFKNSVLNFKPWKQHEYRIHKKIFAFPVACFRSGYDQDWLLRNVGWRSNRRNF